MTTTTTDVVRETAERIRAMLKDWEEGRLPSPDQRDYALAADEVLRARDPHYVIPEDPAPLDGVADDLYEAGEDLASEETIAAFALGRLLGLTFDTDPFDFTYARDALETVIACPPGQREEAVDAANQGYPIWHEFPRETPLERAYRLGEGCGGLDADGVRSLVETSRANEEA